MKNIKKVLFVLSLLLLGMGNITYADTAIHLTISTPASELYDRNITVTPCDSDNDNTTPEITTAYCAILQSEIQNDWNWDWAPGAFLNSLGDIAGFTSKDKDNNDVYHYWSWSSNGIEGATGLNQYELQANDLILLNFVDPQEPEPTPPPSGNSGMGSIIITPTVVSGGSGGALAAIISSSPSILPSLDPAVLPVIKPIFDTKKAFDFLIAQQKENGSFGEDLYNDWVALALASGNYQEQTIKLVKYFGDLKMKDASLTDYERHAMATMSLGLNPYNTNGENYIGKIINSFDGKQFGDVNEDNDDIFALIVLSNAGYTQDEKIISDDIAFILSKQQDNGSWDSSVDMTGASIEALTVFNQNTDPLLTSPLTGGGVVANALTKAKEFLKQNQKDTGGWDNASSTAWALEGIIALNEKPEDWIKNGNTPLDYLSTMQDVDGGIKNLSARLEGENIKNKIWETAYVISVLSGKTWNQIMQKFDKPKEELNSSKTEQKLPKQIIAKNITNNAPQITKTSSKENKVQKTKNLSLQNTATVINSINENKTEPVRKGRSDSEQSSDSKSWFRNLLDKIFNIF